MQHKNRKRRRFMILALLVVGVIAATGAYAYWTQSGSGSGGATTGDTNSITVNQTGAPVTGLYPGGPAQALSGDFDNPNAGAVFVQTVSATVSGTSNAGCDDTDFTITGSPATVNASVASGNGVGSWSGISIAMVNKAVNQDACKNATVNIAYTSS